MDHEVWEALQDARNELYLFVYEHKTLDATQKRQSMSNILMGNYDARILEFLSQADQTEWIETWFLREIVSKIRE